MRKWESEKHKSWDMQGHVAADRSFLGSAGKWGACGWAVVQFDHDEADGRALYGTYGSMEAEHEVQRTIERGRS